MNVLELQTRLLTRLGDDPTASQDQQYYTHAEALVWLNAAQRLFCMLSLCLETTATFDLRLDGTAFYHMLNYFGDWILPLRVRVTGGLKLRPARLADLAALDSQWGLAAGVPIKYALTGFDLMAVYKQPAASTSLDITYARCPAPLILPTDVPEIPPQYHPLLIDGAIPIMRAKEGAQELQKVVALWARYLDGAQKLGDYIRARNREQGYDYLPIELARFDRSRMMLKGAA